MRNVHVRTAFLACAAWMLAACSGGGGDGEDPGIPIDEPVDDPTLFFQEVVSQPFGDTAQSCGESYGAERGMPGDLVRISGIPAAMLEHATVRVISEEADGTPAYGLALLRDTGDANTLEFAVPINPNGDLDGGVVELELGDGETYCERHAFVIQPLPDADPDAAADLADTLTAWLDQLIALYGQDPQGFRDTAAADVDPPLLLLKAYQVMFDGDQSSIIPMLRDAAADDDLTVERLLTAIELEAAYSAALADMAMLPMPEAPSQASAQARSRKAGFSCEVEIPPLSYTFSGPADLAPVMRFANARDIPNEIFGAVNNAAGSIGLIPHPAVKTAATIVGAVGLGLQTSYGILVDLLPSRWGTVTFNVDPQRWPEDRPDSLVGQVSQAEAAAFSTTHNYSKDIASVGFAAATTLGGAAVGARLPGGTVNGVNVADDLLGGVTLAFQEVTNAVIESAAEAFTVCIIAQDFGTFDVTDDQWTRAVINGNAIVWRSEPDRRFIGKNIGEAQIEMVIRKEVFGASNRGARPVTTLRADVESSPAHSLSVSEPGEIVEVSATMPDAMFKDQIDIEIIPASAGSVQGRRFENDQAIFLIETTQDAERYPFKLRLFPTEPGLPPAEPPRDAEVEVHNEGKVTIRYEDDCVEPDETLVFTAELDGFAPDEQSVIWDVFGATVLDSSALSLTVRTPASAGEFTVGAIASADSRVEDEIDVPVLPNCLRKVLYPLADFSTDGNGVYGGSDPDDVEPVCPPGGHDEQQSQSLITDPALIAVIPDEPAPADLWVDRLDTLAANLAHHSTRYRQLGDPPDASCPSYSFTASVSGSAEFEGTAEGELSVRFQSELHTVCENIQDDDGDYVECAAAAASAGVNGVYYIDVTEAASYTLHGYLSCSGLDGYIILNPVSATAIRFVNGTEPYEPTPEEPTGIRDALGNPRSPQLFSAACSTPDEVIFIDEYFTLAAAAEGQTDKVTIGLIGGISVIPGIIDKEGYGPPDPTQVQEPAPGEYSGGGRFELQLQLEEQ